MELNSIRTRWDSYSLRKKCIVGVAGALLAMGLAGAGEGQPQSPQPHGQRTASGFDATGGDIDMAPGAAE